MRQKGYNSIVNIGLSLGEYSALVASGVLSFANACIVVRQRGILMEKEVLDGLGAMAAVIGIVKEIVEETLAKYKHVQIANYNCPGQLVISGSAKEVEKAGEQLKTEGAEKVIRLNVSGQFHLKMLKQAGGKLGKVLQQIQIKPITIPYLANYTGDYVLDNSKVKELLIKQVYSPVKFEQSIQLLIKDGIETFIEIGPGKSLSGFVRKINKNVKTYAVGTVASYNANGLMVHKIWYCFMHGQIFS